MTLEEQDILYMQRCIQLARCGREGAAPNPMVGAVIVCQGRIIGEGYHIRCGGPHAEVNAIRSVKDPEQLKQSTIYVSLEPCAHYGKTPPCADLIIEKQIPRVVIGCQDPFAKVNGLGIRKLRDAGIDVCVGVMEAECTRLNRRFVNFHRNHRPWVTLKWAQSSDGFIDGKRTPEQAPVCFSSPFTQVLVHQMRAQSMAIMVGTNTVLCDNPTLTNRLWPGVNPLRVTIDRHGRIPSSVRLQDGSVPTVVYHDESLQEILADLYQRGVQSLLVEGGACLLGSFLQQGLWDEARVEEAPCQLCQGVPAPSVVQGHLADRQLIDGRWISWYEKTT
ncbi:MAG: bifunctional diaminohydroxyphosphoribosylaminopyrimidine deaminase/5-amino-6-(5-phosphoribosylamino)uracil reductase RibD [Bacteroidaceae bacterium]